MSYESKPDEVLSGILAELKRQTRTLRSMNVAVQVVSMIIILGALLGICSALGLLGSLF